MVTADLHIFATLARQMDTTTLQLPSAVFYERFLTLCSSPATVSNQLAPSSCSLFAIICE